MRGIHLYVIPGLFGPPGRLHLTAPGPTQDLLDQTFVATRLNHDADNLLTAVEIGPDRRLQLIEARLDRLFLQPYSGHYFVIIHHSVEEGTRILRSRSLWAEIAAPLFLAGGPAL